MQVVEVSGRFVDEHKQPIAGRIKFTPQMMWVEEDEVFYPCLGPDVALDEGRFKVLLTRTDQHGPTWRYTVETPMGTWTFALTEDGPIALKELLPKKAV